MKYMHRFVFIKKGNKLKCDFLRILFLLYFIYNHEFKFHFYIRVTFVTTLFLYFRNVQQSNIFLTIETKTKQKQGSKTLKLLPTFHDWQFSEHYISAADILVHKSRYEKKNFICN